MASKNMQTSLATMANTAANVPLVDLTASGSNPENPKGNIGKSRPAYATMHDVRHVIEQYLKSKHRIDIKQRDILHKLITKFIAVETWKSEQQEFGLHDWRIPRDASGRFERITLNQGPRELDAIVISD